MKSYITILVLVGAVGQLRGQLLNVYQDEQIRITRLYAGLRSTTQFSVDSIASYATGDFRIGAMTEHVISRNLKFNAWGVVHLEKNKKTAVYNSFAIQFDPTAKMSFQAGLTATPTTVLRPNPTTWQSHVELKTQQTIIPGKPGGKLSYQLTSDFKVTYGYFYHENGWIHHGNLSYQRWQLAGYGSAQQMDFLALKYTSDNIESTTTFALQQSANTLMKLNLGANFSVLTDAAYDQEKKELDIRRVAIRRHFYVQRTHLSGFLEMSYDWESRAVIGQMFIYLY